VPNVVIIRLDETCGHTDTLYFQHACTFLFFGLIHLSYVKLVADLQEYRTRDFLVLIVHCSSTYMHGHLNSNVGCLYAPNNVSKQAMLAAKPCSAPTYHNSCLCYCLFQVTLKTKLVWITFKNSLCTSKGTQYFTQCKHQFVNDV
jgi:hypothetical protein